MEVEIYMEIENIGEVTLFSDVSMKDEGCMPNQHDWCAVSEDEIGFDDSLYSKSKCIKIEDYIEENEEEIREILGQQFIDNCK